MVYKKLVFRLVPGQDIRPEQTIILRPTGHEGVKMTILQR